MKCVRMIVGFLFFGVAFCFAQSGPVHRPVFDEQKSQIHPSSQKGYIPIAIEKLKGGYLVVNLELQSKSLCMILDTGTVVTCLDKQRTGRLQLRWSESDPLQKKDESVWKWSKSKCDVDGGSLGPIAIPRTTVYAYDASIVNKNLLAIGDKQVDGMLGIDILRSLGAIIDLSEMKLFLRSAIGSPR